MPGGLIAQLANSAFREFATEGVQASGINEPVKAEVRAVFQQVDAALASLALFSAIGVIFDTAAHMNADLAHGAGTPALVYADGTAANDGVYVKTGASGVGAWVATGITLPSGWAASVAALLVLVPTGQHACQVAQLKMELVTGGNFQTVQGSIPGEQANPITQQWLAGGYATPAGPLGQSIKTTLGLDTAGLNALFDAAAALTI